MKKADVYELEPGDMINRTGRPAIGVLIEKIVAPNGHVSWQYVLRSPNLKSWRPQIGSYVVDEDVLYESVEEGKVEVHYGTLKNRKPRNVN